MPDRTNAMEVEGFVSREADGDVRRRLARELHDTVAQTLTLMVVDMEHLKREQAGHDGVVEQVDRLQASTREVLQQLRNVLYDLREEPVIEVAFVRRARELVARFQAATGVRARLRVAPAWPERMAAATAHDLYRILQEALNNVRLHSGASSVEVDLAAAAGRLGLTVRDNGRGVAAGDGDMRQGMGMLGMRERAVLLGGALHIDGNGSGGTTVRAVLPVAPREKRE